MSALSFVKQPAFLVAAGAPLALDTLSGTDAGQRDNVRRATGLAAILAGGLFIATGSTVARNVAVGAGASWAVLKMGVL